MGRPIGSKNKVQKPKPEKKPNGRPEEWTEERALELANGLMAWLAEDENENIFFQEYLLKHRIPKQKVSELTSKFDSFLEIIKEAKQIQEFRINKLALKQKINPVMAIFTLKNLHNWADKQEVKTENLNYNYEPSDLRQKTAEELQELLNVETNTTQ